MSNNENLATEASVIKTAISSALKDLHTSMPGIVDSFDPETQTASVQPAIKRRYKTETGSETIITPVNLPLCINVPVAFPRAGGYAMTFPVKQGDECLLEFCERSFDKWYEEGGVQEPAARRFHDLSDGVAILGLYSKPNKLSDFNTEAVEIRNEDASISLQLGSFGVKIKGNLEINGNITHSGNLDMTGNLDVTGNVTSNGKNLLH